MFCYEQILQSGNAVFVQVGSLLNVLFTVICIVAVYSAFQKGKYRGWKVTPEALLCFGLLSLAALSLIWSICPDITIEKGKKSIPYLGAFVLIMPLCATDQKQLRLAINVTIFLGGIILLGQAFATYGRRSIVLQLGNSDIDTNPLAVASYAGYVGICALFSIYGKKFSPEVAVKIAIFCLGVYVIFKGSVRGQLIALTVVCFIWLPIIAQATFKRSTIFALLGSMVIVGSILYALYQVRETGRWQMTQVESATEGRYFMVTSLLEYWSSAGVGAWMLGLGSSSAYDIIGFYPHNVPVEVLAEEGLLGFIIYACFGGVVLRRAGKLMFSKNLEQVTRVNLGILLALFCFDGILSLKQGSLIGSSSWMGMGVTVGWITSRLEKDKRKNIQQRQNMSYYYAQVQQQQDYHPNYRPDTSEFLR